MRQVFVDTGAFYAALNRKDQYHREAARLFDQAVAEEWRVLTSNFVVAETHAVGDACGDGHHVLEGAANLAADDVAVRVDAERLGAEQALKLRRHVIVLDGLIMLVLVMLCESYIAANDLKFSRLEAEDWRSSARVARGELPPGGVW